MPEIKKYTITEPWLDLSCALGEAPFFNETRNELRFVDIEKDAVHYVNLDTSSHKEWSLMYNIGITADIEGNDDEFLFGGKLGYGLFNRSTGEHRIIKNFWTDEKDPETKEHRCRSNDGSVDSKGRFFVGTMNDQATVPEFTDEGVLFRLDPDLSLHRMKEGVTIPNGMSWTSDNKTMYFTDSPSQKIMAYPYDEATGKISFNQGKVFFTCPIEGGVPDGHCQDEHGFLWVACHGTARVYRLDLNGNIVAEIELPTRCVTCPAFCGTELVVTSAAEQEPEKHPWSKRYGGAVFKIDVGVRGKPLNKFKMNGKA
ncbi:related to gluconolactonase [Ramularia collo-cygni]|uniref:Related to gluconolactonase n=1 Tax=Ramularia collo-cygni TaxID=112498 RepID=A0A2D3V3C1_9PEZI|nr:related to gluconolactonase [Ramularia collo-cygni]CZT16994.1 related to gluconolactonase [Ramularia collo-cygni]